MEICHVTQFFQQLERMNKILSEGESACSESRQQQKTGTNASREQFGEEACDIIQACKSIIIETKLQNSWNKMIPFSDP